MASGGNHRRDADRRESTERQEAIRTMFVNLHATEQTLLLAAEAGGQHRLIIQTVLGGQEADLLAAAHDGQVDELGLSLALDARAGTHFILFVALVSNSWAAM